MDYNSFKKKITLEEALIKAQKYCAYRDRCIYEVEQKLKEWGLPASDFDAVIDDLVETNFINERRFLMAFVRGKFNLKKWGRYKIKAALKEKRLNEEDVLEALGKLDQKEYLKTAKALIQRKLEELQGTEERLKKNKVYYYMLSKGYEPNLVITLLN